MARIFSLSVRSLFIVITRGLVNFVNLNEIALSLNSRFNGGVLRATDSVGGFIVIAIAIESSPQRYLCE